MLSHKDLIRFAFTNEFVLEGGFRLDAISPPYSYLSGILSTMSMQGHAVHDLESVLFYLSTLKYSDLPGLK